MVEVKEEVMVYFEGSNSLLLKGAKYPKNAKIVKAFPSYFELEQNIPAKKPKEIKVEDKVKPKEELLIEEPVSTLKVTEEPTEEVKPKRATRTRAKKATTL